MGLFFDKNKEKRIIHLEGNIGAGKSTLLKKLFMYFPSVDLIFEPHECWQNVNGENLLDYFYKDMKRWAYSFQSYAFLSRIKSIENAFLYSKSKLFFSERSVYADYFTFARALYDMGEMNNLEWEMYKSWHKWIVEKYAKKPSAYIYLRVSPKTSYYRILKRSRNEECKISISYLELINSYHEEWLVNMGYDEYNMQNIPILIIDGELDFENDENAMSILVEKIRDFLFEDSGEFRIFNHEVSFEMV